MPGRVAGFLDRKAGDFVTTSSSPSARTRGGHMFLSMLIGLAQANGRSTDPVVRQELARVHVLGEVGRLNAERLKSVRAAGQDIPGMANISKLLMSDIVRRQRDVGLDILGPSGMLHGYDDEQRAQLRDAGQPLTHGAVTSFSLYAQAPPIYGGTDQIQRNIIGERALGLPKEPSTDKDLPFSELPKNG
jgi:alkylation response protein AidB-like acyl-CoA dehydrogenase